MAAVELFADYKPIPKAVPFHRSVARFVALGCGTRGSKTFSGAREFLKRIYQDRARKTSKSLRYWVCAPTYELTEVARSELFEAIPPALFGGYNQQRHILTLAGNIEVGFRSTDKPQNLVSVGLDGLWIDETARVKPDAWRGQLRQRLSDRLGWSIFTTTPLGRNWFFDDIVARSPKMGGSDPDYDFYTWTTADNTSVPWLVQEVEKARLELPEAYFLREYCASFDAFHGQVYQEYKRETHVWSGPLPTEIYNVIYSYDPGFHHMGVLLAILVLNDGQMLVAAECAEQYRDNQYFANVAREWQDRWGNGSHPLFYDPADPVCYGVFNSVGIQAQRADNDVINGIATVARALHPIDGRPRLMIHESCENLLKEITAYVWDDAARREQPIKKDDHSLDSLRYAVHTADRDLDFFGRHLAAA